MRAHSCIYILRNVCFYGIILGVQAVVDACFKLFHLLHHLGDLMFHAF